MTHFPNPGSKHHFELGVEKDGIVSRISVDANTRAQAAKIAKEHGYAVRDVNMVG